MEALGRHILVEFFLCDPNTLNDVETIETAMVEAAEISGATIINSDFHHFSPYGVSGVVVIEESHLALHTWPEYQYAAADLFTCGDDVNPWLAFDHLKAKLQSKTHSALELHRGSLHLLKRIPFNAENYRKIAEDRMKHKTFPRSIWITDKDENIALSLRASGGTLYDKTSDFQRVRVYQSYGFGKVLTIDNIIMCTEKDEAHYHEMIAHPAIFSHGKIENVLVIGGGDGGTVREILRHPEIKKVTMVEIDELVVEASKLHLPQISSALDNPKLEIKIEDGIKFVHNAADESYDLVIVDGSDPVGPAEGLFSESFYRHIYRILKNDGILVTQGESPMFNENVFQELNVCLKNIFGDEKVEVLLFNIATYPSGIWSFQIGVKGEKKLTDFDEEKARKFTEEHQLRYYNEEIHRASFVLPNYVQKMLLKTDD
ncbi:spermidine synthase [candidate division KSB1 bacterium 4484_87]|nr:MAG: spermidine synthase [candidate division KSB1 bacterium 4484_87]